MEGKQSGGEFVLISLRTDCARQEFCRPLLQPGIFVVISFFLHSSREKKFFKKVFQGLCLWTL